MKPANDATPIMGKTRCTGYKCWQDEDGIYYTHSTSEGTLYGKSVCPLCKGTGFVTTPNTEGE